MALSDEKYLRLTTFRRTGTPVVTPVWVVSLASGDVGFWTSSGSGKSKRLAHTDRVLVQASDSRGKPKPASSEIEATARMATAAEMDEIRTNVTAKYGFMTKLTKVLGAIGGIVKRKRIPYGDVGVVITLPS